MKSFLLYIDPGIGSLAAQAVIAGFAAVMVFFKNGIGNFFKHTKIDSDNKNNDKEVS